MATRRAVLHLALAGAAVGLAGRAAALERSTKAKAHYQDNPKDVRSCVTCSYFVSRNACTVLEGEVSKHGFCDLYVMVD